MLAALDYLAVDGVLDGVIELRESAFLTEYLLADMLPLAAGDAQRFRIEAVDAVQLPLKSFQSISARILVVTAQFLFPFRP